MGCSLNGNTKEVVTPVEKIVYIDRLKPSTQIQRCEKPKAESLSVEDLLALIPKLDLALDRCNIGIDAHNKQIKDK